MSKPKTPEQRELSRALMALYLAVDSSVADDINAKVSAALQAERARAEKLAEALKKYSNADLKGNKFFVKLPCEDKWCHISHWARVALKQFEGE